MLAAFAVGEKQAGQRLDLFLKGRIPRLSRARIQEAIGCRVRVRGRAAIKASLILRPGDVVEVCEAAVVEPPFPAALEPAVIHADDTLVAVDKPAGLPVHSTRKVVKNQLVRWLRDRYGTSLALAHRIDRETSGIVVATRSPAAARALGRDFARGAVRKEYLAVVHGTTPERFEVDLAIGPDPASAVHIKQAAGVAGGAPSRTRFQRETVAASGAFSLVRAFPETGRRHQIRVHLAAAGHPVVGDKLYAAGERHFLNFITRGPTDRMLAALLHPRHLLHAAVLVLDHPGTGAVLRLAAPVPPDFADFLARGWA